MCDLEGPLDHLLKYGGMQSGGHLGQVDEAVSVGERRHAHHEGLVSVRGREVGRDGGESICSERSSMVVCRAPGVGLGGRVKVQHMGG